MRLTDRSMKGLFSFLSGLAFCLEFGLSVSCLQDVGRVWAPTTDNNNNNNNNKDNNNNNNNNSGLVALKSKRLRASFPMTNIGAPLLLQRRPTRENAKWRRGEGGSKRRGSLASPLLGASLPRGGRSNSDREGDGWVGEKRAHFLFYV